MPDIAIVTCRVLPEPDPDEAPLLEACAAAGLDVELAAWDDPAVDWGRYRVAILRSCWNYYQDPPSFRSWIDRVSAATSLWNYPDVVRGNLDKRYLARLADLGVPIVPTRFLNPESSIRDALAETGWERFVIKPTISAASFMTRRFCRSELEAAEAFVCEVLSGREAMLQPYIESVDRGGEIAAVHIDGVLTHCVVKTPRFVGGDESVSVAFQPNVSQAAAARHVMNAIKAPWLYARVDLMEASTGEWLLSELELIEPSLFLSQHPPALRRLIAALQRL